MLLLQKSTHFIYIVSIFVITFIQGIYNELLETSHVSTVYIVAAVLYLQFLLHVMLFRNLNIFYTFTLLLWKFVIIIIIIIVDNCAVKSTF